MSAAPPIDPTLVFDAVGEARRRGDHAIGPEHLLVAAAEALGP